MKQFIAIFIISLIAHATTGQTQYLDSIYSTVDVSTHAYHINRNETLKLDYYLAGKNRKNVPLIVVVHGGGFVGGARNSEDMVSFAKQLAYRGYAVASVSYRLTMIGIGFGCDVEKGKKIEAINSASQDISQAVKYLTENEEKFQIDQNKVILLGSSAGAEAVLNMVYGKKDTSFDFDYAGIISMAGAIITLDHLNDKTAIPSQFFHGTGDELVPYNIAPHHYCNTTDKGYMMLYGSKAMADRLKGLGKSYYLYSVKGGSHSWATLPMTSCLDEISDFLYGDVINLNPVRQTERSIGN